MKKIISLITTITIVFALSACSLDINNDDITTLEEQIALLQTAVEDMQSDLNEKDDLISQLQTDQIDADTLISTLNTQVLALQTQLVTVNSTLVTLSTNDDDISEAYDAMLLSYTTISSNIDDLLVLIEDISLEFTTYSSDFASILNSLENLQNQIDLIIYNPDGSSLENQIVNTFNMVSDGVIGVSNLQYDELNNLYTAGVGSGVVYYKDNFTYRVVTNYHVVEGADAIEIYLGDGIYVDATVLGTDSTYDLAVVEFTYEDKVLPVLTFADSTLVQTGDFVLAIGNPLGYEHYNSLTFGVVSEPLRFIYNDYLDGYQDPAYVQTDAALNPGNSGGALLNIYGEIVGINVLKETYTLVSDGEYIAVDNLGFAISASQVERIISELELGLSYSKPLLGVLVNAENNQINVLEVSTGSVADTAGILAGDIILEFNNYSVSNLNEFKFFISLTYVGDTVDVKILRDGEELVLTLNLINGA